MARFQARPLAIACMALALAFLADAGSAGARTLTGSAAGAATVPACVSGRDPLFTGATASLSEAIEGGFALEAIVLHRIARNYMANALLGANVTGDGRDDGPALASLTAPVHVIRSGSAEDSGSTHLEARGLSGFPLEASVARQIAQAIIGDLCGEPATTPATPLPGPGARTDYWTSFREGWASHLSAVAFDHARSPSDAAHEVERSLDVLRRWESRMAAEAPVEPGWGRAAMASAFRGRPGAATLSYPLWHIPHAYASWVCGTRSGAFRWSSRGGLRNPSEMLGTPGVVSSMFYSLVTDPRVQWNYRQPDFYAAFLFPESDRGATRSDRRTWPQSLPAPSMVFTPLQNAYTKAFHVLASSVTPGVVHATGSPAVAFTMAYARAFPDEADAAYDAFLWATGGCTVDPDLASRLAPLSASETPRSRDQYRECLSALRQAVAEGERGLDQAVGPQLWLRNPAHTTGICVYDLFEAAPAPCAFDLNAAESDDLMAVPGMTVEAASAILAERRDRHHFETIQELAQVKGLTPEILNGLQAAKSEMDAYLAGSRPTALSPVTLNSIAMSYVVRLGFRVLAGLAVCLGVALALRGVYIMVERRFFGGWEPPSWVNPNEGRAVRMFGALVKIIATSAALAAMIFVLPPWPPLHRFTMGLAAGTLAWMTGTLPEIVGISAFAGLSRRYVRFRVAWSLVSISLIAGVAFTIM